MPYVACPGCAVRSYVVAGRVAKPCPVCQGPLPTVRPVQAREGRPLRDAELVARHREGDAQAFATLHERHVGALRRLARRLVGPAGAEDVVQEAFERAHRFILSDPRAVAADFAMGAWLRTVVHHRCIDDLRREVAAVELCEEAAPASTLGPHERVLLSEELRRLGAAVRALPVRQREALVRCVLDGESHGDVARRLDVSVAATKSLVSRARGELRHSAAA